MDPLDSELQSLFTHDRFVRRIARGIVSDAAADDVVQETWWAAINRPHDGARPLLPWLKTIARNFALKARRGEARRREREAAAASPEASPSAAALVEREATRRAVVNAVLSLPEPMREAVILRYFDGLPPRAIAKRTGEPVETVKSRLKRALGLLREKLDPGRERDRKTFGAALLALAHGPSGAVGLSAAATFEAVILGALAMTKGAKAAAALGALIILLIGGAWFLRPVGSNDSHAPAPPAGESAMHETGEPAARSAGSATRINPTPWVESSPTRAAAPEPATGSLLVHVLFADGTAAADVGVAVGSLQQAWSDGSTVEKRTDFGGSVSFVDLPVGSPEVSTDRGESGQTATVEGGKQSELTLTLQRGFDVEGIVVDEAGAPVAGADVVLDQGVSRQGGRAVAVSAKDGTFGVRGVRFALGIGARASGFAPSVLADLGTALATSLQGLASRAGATRVRLVLARGGAALEGRVLGPDGEPVAGAMVLLGGEESRRVRVPLEKDEYGFAPTAFLTRSGTDGSFRFPSLPARLLAATARARGFAVWKGRFSPDASGTPFLIRLERGVTVSGVVSDPEGKPAQHALVRVGDEYRFGTSQAATGANGAYSIGHVATGEIRLSAEANQRRTRASAMLAASPGQDLIWNATLSEGLAIRGKVVNAQGRPRLAQVECYETTTKAWAGGTQTDVEGKFRLTNLSDVGHTLTVVPGRGVGALVRIEGVRPGGPELVLTIPADAEGAGTITGRVVDAAGKPIALAQVSPWNLDALSGVIQHTDEDGRFNFTEPPGRYKVDVKAAGFPFAQSAEHLLKNRETWDVGAIELERGGQLEATVRRSDGSAAGRPKLTIRALDRTYSGILVFKSGDVATSELLPPGRYELTRGTDPGPIPFSIAAGETTKLPVTIEPAVARTLRIADDGPQVSGLIHVFDPALGGLCDESVTRQGSEPFEYRLVLDPGTYQLEIEADSGRSAKATIVVPDRTVKEAVIPVSLK